MTFRYVKWPDFLRKWYERCELEAENPLSMTTVMSFLQRWIQRNIRPMNVGVAHSNQRNFFNILRSRIIKRINSTPSAGIPLCSSNKKSISRLRGVSCHSIQWGLLFCCTLTVMATNRVDRLICIMCKIQLLVATWPCLGVRSVEAFVVSVHRRCKLSLTHHCCKI